MPPLSQDLILASTDDADDEDVDVAALVEKGAVRKGQPVKVLGTGDITVKVNVTAQKFSATAKDKIEAAGGSVTAE